MNIILFNPLSGNGNSIKSLNKYIKKYKVTDYKVVDITTTKIDSVSYKDSDCFVIIGGDGTIHTLCNEIKRLNISIRVFLYKAGSGNDFIRDFKNDYLEITNYIKNAPISNNHYYLTGSGFGVDGLVCDNVNKDTKSNYYRVALKTFKSFKKFDLKLIVDNKEYNFKDVWFSTIMNGRCIGGGMILSPKSNRLDNKVEVCVVHNLGLLKLITIFPSIFKGLHLRFKKNIFLTSGSHITMIASEKQVMQSDGEIYGLVDTIEVKI